MSTKQSGVTIEAAGSEIINQLKPLWIELHRHHQGLSPELAPYVDDEESWTLPTNQRVLELYSRRGFRPTWLVMTRFKARGTGS
jgi:hypothetical protein